MDIYGKGEREDLSATEKTALKSLGDQYKRDAIKLVKAKEKS